MIVLVFDTETTGLPKNNPSIYSTNSWPHIVQLSYVLYDVDKRSLITEQDMIIKLPKDVDIPEESVKIHKITKEKSDKLGIPIETALTLFFKDAKQADLFVGHNLSFDKRMIIVECIRKNLYGRFPKEESKFYCTMKKGTDLCKIEAINKKTQEKYFKYPTLSELYLKIFNSTAQGAHNALVDVHLCLACYLEMTL